jgi:NAD(P)-dependent dehydrogenase (short-subunit alcohol dehydrogenase family)
MDDTDRFARFFRLDGQFAAVTGAGEGMGRAIAVGLARSGATVGVLDIADALVQETVAQIGTLGGQALAVHCDVSSAEEVERAFDALDAQFGRLDILVNNAGVNDVSSAAEDYPLDGWERMMAINLTGPFLCARLAGRRMIAQGGGGSIINISSIVGESAANRGSLAFGAAKAGLDQLTRDLAVEWAPHGIRVNAILPCQFRTRGWAQTIEDPANADLVRTVLHGIPLGRMGDPEEIVGPVVFLASQAASMVTGVLLPVDGGNLAMNAGAGGLWPSRRTQDVRSGQCPPGSRSRPLVEDDGPPRDHEHRRP